MGDVSNPPPASPHQDGRHWFSSALFKEIFIRDDIRELDYHLEAVGRLACSSEPASYAAWTFSSPGRVTHASQVKGQGPDKERSTSPPGLGFCTGLTTLSCEQLFVTETATCDFHEASVQNEPSESTPWTAGHRTRPKKSV